MEVFTGQLRSSAEFPLHGHTGSATKGAGDYHWAMIEITPDDTPPGQDDGHGFLLLRRHRYTGTVSYFPVLEPRPGSRWRS